MFETLGHYRILDRIGAGGMGEVYRARDTRFGRTVAIKVVTAAIAGDPERRERFLRDARASAALSHPNIATLYEIGEDQGELFLVLEFVPGETLHTVIAGRPLNTRRAIEFAVQIADAVADVHAAGIVHRDIRPANIVITPKDKTKLLDVGFAGWTGGGAEREHAAYDAATATERAAPLGTVAYMSPEQALGERGDHRTDIFSLGIVLFEMLTGRLPFTGATAPAMALQIVHATAPSPSAVNPSLPPEVDAIVARALAKGLDQRYESAVTLAAELRSIGAILDVRSEASEAAGPPVAVAAPRRRPGAGWLVGLVLLAAIGAGAWMERARLERVWRRNMGPPPAPVLAVLPFDTDAGRTYFADGVADDLMARLGQTPGLTVLGRTAMRGYRGRTARDAARELGAAVVLTGSVHAAGDALQLSLALVEPADEVTIWSAQYARDPTDVFAMDAQAAEDIASALRVKLQPTGSSARAASRLVDRRAYDLYLRGRQATVERQLPEAIASYEQAIAADAGLSEAFAGVAEALHAEATSPDAPNAAARRTRLRTAAARAYELDPDLPQANAAMSLASDALADALKYLRRAVELDPSYADAYRIGGDQLQDFDPPLAIAFFRKALMLDPRVDAAQAGLATALASTGRDPGAGANRGATAVTANVRSNPRSWSRRVAALRQSGAGDEAFAEATALVAKFPQDCDARSLLAALSTERRASSAAHTLADGLLARAKVETASRADLRCALHAAAALQNATQAAALLDRIAAQEAVLRAFAAATDGQTGTMWLDPRAFPWSLVAAQPVVAAARERLDAAYARERETARSVLAGLP